ncbi:putative membrane protein [Oopsacas minuta]|uniref:Transmembrane protein 192 n=1 Tax=Oopsacas minuta TaxID=111878 RepID=A0AAV7JQC7_9METZ|nr:putative membrane protein [Oopsacas minuta]
MVSLGDNNQNGNNGAGQFFRESDGDYNPPLPAYDIPKNNRSRHPRSALCHPYHHSTHHTTRTTLESNSNSLMPTNSIKYRHIFTCYFTIAEILIVLLFVIACFVDILVFDSEQREDEQDNIIAIDKFSIYSIVHIILWCLVGVFDRLIQWQHQIIRRRGYLRFYIKLRNIRRVPFGVFSTGNATLVLLFATRKQLEAAIQYTPFKFNYCMLILVGVELILTLPVLLYYIIITMRFNCKRPSPDATVSSSSQSVLPFSSPPPDLGFNTDTDTHNVEELLDKQADMIRYLQFHNANLGRKIMELQNQNRH